MRDAHAVQGIGKILWKESPAWQKAGPDDLTRLHVCKFRVCVCAECNGQRRAAHEDDYAVPRD